VKIPDYRDTNSDFQPVASCHTDCATAALFAPLLIPNDDLILHGTTVVLNTEVCKAAMETLVMIAN
jgi:hypothetical protein